MSVQWSERYETFYVREWRQSWKSLEYNNCAGSLTLQFKMSSPSAGKRRMDTDVIKLYPLLPSISSAEQGQDGVWSAVLCFDIAKYFEKLIIVVLIFLSTDYFATFVKINPFNIFFCLKRMLVYLYELYRIYKLNIGCVCHSFVETCYF